MTTTLASPPAATAAPVTGQLLLTGLTKQYTPTAKPAVDNIDLEIHPGEFLTLLGPSGCGKTTTLRMIAGFETPTAGTISLDGADIGQLTPDKRPMAMVFQSYALFPHMSVAENVSYGLKLRKLPKARIEEEVSFALTAMSLADLAQRAPNQLSGGQQQRVALARAMVMKPKVLLFDEPLSNLDAKLRVQMRTEIRSLQRRLGITSIYVTHDQDEAMSLSDRIVVMNAGRIEQVADPGNVYRRPASIFVADFIGRANFLEVEATELSGGKTTVDAFGKARRVAVHPDVLADGEASLLIRPESVIVEGAPNRAGDVQGDRGRVLSSVFYGPWVEYEIETEIGNVTAVVYDPLPENIMEPTDMVSVSFREDQAWVLPDR